MTVPETRPDVEATLLKMQAADPDNDRVKLCQWIQAVESALSHAAGRDHVSIPAICDGCTEVQDVLMKEGAAAGALQAKLDAVEDAECECEHTFDEHDEDGCNARASSSAQCACPGFKAAT